MKREELEELARIGQDIGTSSERIALRRWLNESMMRDNDKASYEMCLVDLTIWLDARGDK